MIVQTRSSNNKHVLIALTNGVPTMLHNGSGSSSSFTYDVSNVDYVLTGYRNDSQENYSFTFT